jgi:iron complex outermembrane receptor protein
VSVCLFFLPLFALNSHAETREKRFPSLQDFLTLPLEAVAGTTRAIDGTIFNLGEVKVSGARVSSERSDEVATRLPYNVTLIGETELEEAPQGNLTDLLGSKEGVTLSDELGNGLNARVDLRGFGGEAKQALVLFEGLRAVEPFDNSTTWHLYPSEFLRRVEIRRGGGSTIYGEGAFSGSIDLKTKEPTEELRVATEHSFGDFGTRKHFVEAGGTRGVGLYVGARYLTTDGYRQNGGHEGAATLLKTRYDWTEYVRLENAFYFADAETGIPGPLTRVEMERDRRQKDPDGQYGDQFADKLVQDAVTATWYLEGPEIEFSNLLGYRLRNQDTVQSFGGFFGGTSINGIETETFSNVLQANWRREGDRFASSFTTGIEYSHDDIYNPFSFTSFSFGAFDAERSIDRQMAGLFVQDRVEIGDRFIVEAGARFDDIEWDIYDLKTPSLEKHKKADHVSPKIGAEYRVFEPLTLYTSWSEAFRAPDANTLIFETPNLFTPNPAIDPQIARHSEIGARYAHPVFGSVRVDYFYIETKKEILFNAISTLNENYDTRRQGFELADEVALGERVQLFTNYTYTSAEFDNGVFDGKDVPLVPEHQWSAGIVASLTARLTASCRATGVRGRYALNDFNNLVPVKNYWVFDGKITYKRKPWEVYLRTQNLLDQEYSSFVTSNGTAATVNFNPAPARYVEAGFKMEI